MLLNFRNQIDWGRNVKALGDNSEGLVDWRQLLRRKLDVYNRADYLHHAAGCPFDGRGSCARRSHTFFLLLFVADKAKKPEGLKASQDTTGAKVAPSERVALI